MIEKFGRLIILNVVSNDRFGFKRVNCLCDCGNQKIVRLDRLRSGNTQSCGCLRIENATKQLAGASQANPLLKDKSEPRIATAKIVYRRYSDGNLSFEKFLELSQKNCFYCGTSPCSTTNYYITKNSKYSKERISKGYFTYNGLDRVDSSKPHNIDNVVPSCITCNKAKLQQSQVEFFDWISRVYNLHCVE